MPFTLDGSGAIRTIRLEGEIGINCAAELKGILLDALQGGGEIRISLGGALAMDVTAMQLLWAAEKAAGAAGAVWLLEDSWPQNLRAALQAAGFQKLPFEARICQAGGEA